MRSIRCHIPLLSVLDFTYSKLSLLSCFMKRYPKLSSCYTDLDLDLFFSIAEKKTFWKIKCTKYKDTVFKRQKSFYKTYSIKRGFLTTFISFCWFQMNHIQHICLWKTFFTTLPKTRLNKFISPSTSTGTLGEDRNVS